MPVGFRRHRAGPRAFKLHKPAWVDPYPQIPGTEPEKRIFAELVSRRLFFVFQDTLPDFEEGLYTTLGIPRFIPDFLLPEYKVIIDPFSEFHHSLPGAVERDAWKFVVYESMGYSFYHPWSNDVAERGAARIIAEIPEFDRPPKHELTDPRDIAARIFPGYRLGRYLGAGATSVAAANRRRRRPASLRLRLRR